MEQDVSLNTSPKINLGLFVILSIVITGIVYAVWELVRYFEFYYVRIIVSLIVQQIAFWVTYFVSKRKAKKKGKAYRGINLLIIPPIALILFNIVSYIVFLFLLGSELFG